MKTREESDQIDQNRNKFQIIFDNNRILGINMGFEMIGRYR